MPIRAPYGAAPASSSAPWPPPPAITTNGPQGLAGPGTRSRSMPPPLRPRRSHRLRPPRQSGTRGVGRGAGRRRAGGARRGGVLPTLFLMAAGGTSRDATVALPARSRSRDRASARNCRSTGFCSISAAAAPVLSAGPRSSSKPISRSTASYRRLPSLSHGTTSARRQPGASNGGARSLRIAVVVEEAVGARLEEGLATRPDSCSPGRSGRARHSRCRTRWVASTMRKRPSPTVLASRPLR